MEEKVLTLVSAAHPMNGTFAILSNYIVIHIERSRKDVHWLSYQYFCSERLIVSYDFIITDAETQC